MHCCVIISKDPDNTFVRHFVISILSVNIC